VTKIKKNKSTKKVENIDALGLPIVLWPKYSPQKLHLTHFTLFTEIILKIYRDGEMELRLRTIAPPDAINVIQPLHVCSIKNLTNQGGITSQNNTLQLHTIGF
jgi:hypothetical protein